MIDSRNADFEDVLFNGYADFRNSKFNRSATFLGDQFLRDAGVDDFDYSDSTDTPISEC